MSELTLLLLRVAFLLILWVFIFAIVYALRSDLFGAPVRKMKPGAQAISEAPSPKPAPAAAPVMSSPAHPVQHAAGPASKLIITSGPAAGTSLPLDTDRISIGRSGDSTLVIVDEYTSSHHATLNRQGDEWVLTDLDSTNGTKLAGDPVRRPVPVPLNTPITIGTTTFELRA